MRDLVLSDIHADARALDRVLEDAEGRWDRLLLLGDLIGYGSEPRETVERLRGLSPAAAVRGNHEWMLARLHAGHQVAAAPPIREALMEHRRALSEEDLAWLLSLPERHVQEGGDRDLELVHGHPDPERPFAYLISVPEARAAAEHARRPVVLVGHTHVPGGFVERDGAWRPFAARKEEARLEVSPGSRAFLNPGSVSLPRDGGPPHAYLIWDGERGSALIRRFA